MKKIKLCPRCNYGPLFRFVGDNKQFLILECPECGFCPAKIGDARRTIRGAIKVWNKGCENEKT